MSGGTYKRDVAIADALQRERLQADADALRACTGAAAVTVRDVHRCAARTDGGDCTPFHVDGDTCEYCGAPVAATSSARD